MVSPARIFPLAVLLPLLFSVLVRAQDFPNFLVGEAAPVDLTAPAAFTVIDPPGTELLRRQIAAADAAYFRGDAAAAAQAEQAFRASVVRARKQFLGAFEKTFGSNRVAAASVTAAPIKQFCTDYRAGKNAFPARGPWLTLWLTGESDAALVDELSGKLRAQAERWLCPDELPSELTSSPMVRLLPAPAADLATAERMATETPRAQLIPRARARAELLAALPKGQQAGARFLGGLLRVNCTPEAELSRQSRTRQTEAAISALHFEAGQVIVARGEVVTARTKLALDKAAQLSEKLTAQQRAARPLAAAKISVAPAAPAPPPWEWLALGLVLPLVGVAGWRWARRRRAEIILPMTLASRRDAADGAWRERALRAEERADRATAIVREGLLPQLANVLSNEVVKQLVTQRTELLDSHEQAASELEQLAARLEKLEAVRPQEYYAARIAELEKELASKSAENRALLQARIEVVQQQLAAAHRRVDWN